MRTARLVQLRKMVNVEHKLFGFGLKKKRVLFQPLFTSLTSPSDQDSSVKHVTNLVGDLVRRMAELRNPASQQSGASIQILTEVVKNMVTNWTGNKITHKPNNFVRLLKRTSHGEKEIILK